MRLVSETCDIIRLRLERFGDEEMRRIHGKYDEEEGSRELTKEKSREREEEEEKIVRYALSLSAWLRENRKAP